MPDIIIKTDGTVQGTSLKVDGKDETADNKIVSISFYCSAPYRSKFSGETVPGSVNCVYELANDNGVIERKSVCADNNEYSIGIGAKIENDDAVTRYIGKQVDRAILILVDKIIEESEKAKVPCPSKAVLLSRSLASLQDKASDLGIKVDVPAVQK